MSLFLLLCLFGLGSSIHICYDEKCKNYGGTYIDCDQEYMYCEEGTWYQSAECSYNMWDGFQGKITCSDSETCVHDYYTGKGKCIEYPDDYGIVGGIYMVAILGAGGLAILISVCCCCYCYCTKKCCFSQRRGHVINRPAENIPMVNMQPQNPPAKAAYPPGQYPPVQGGYLPAQGAYPPTQGAYPPAQGAYPPAQGAYPPAQGTYPPTQGAYPPAQDAYPPAQGAYPPAQGAYPPAQGAYPPPPVQGSHAHGCNPAPGCDPAASGSNPPPAYNSVVPDENLYYKS